MSTKCSHVYLDRGHTRTHIYTDVADPGNFYIEKTSNQDIVVKLSLHEIGMLVKAFDVNELERQANLTDEQILNHVKADYCKNKNSSWCKMWYRSLCNVENPTDEDLMESQLKHLIKTRDKLIALRNLMNSEGRVSHHIFGLEEIK